MRYLISGFALSFFAVTSLVFSSAAFAQSEVAKMGRALFNQTDTAVVDEALEYFKNRKNLDSVGVLTLAMRFSPNSPSVGDVLEEVTGENFGQDWNKWMLWQERHLEAKPFEGFNQIHADVHKRVDGNFQLFLGGDHNYDIRVEEITWGGVVKDGIPALTNPKLLTREQATYMEPENLVFGVNINGDARAYPLRILDWHEMFNDVVGGVPVSLAYCTLCGSGILYETQLEGYPHHLTLGSSGFLYRSNKLMYDTYTHSLWNQFTGKPVAGPLAGTGVELKVRPVVITTWEKWQEENPSTKVISIDTGYQRDYGTGVAYAQYWASDDLMFPAAVDTSVHKAKDYVFSLREGEVKKAWPIKFFKGGKVINDEAGSQKLVLIGDEESRTVRAFNSNGIVFSKTDNTVKISGDGKNWQITEDALVAEDGTKLARLAGHIGFWFAWENYYGKEGEVASLN